MSATDINVEVVLSAAVPDKKGLSPLLFWFCSEEVQKKHCSKRKDEKLCVQLPVGSKIADLKGKVLDAMILTELRAFVQVVKVSLTKPTCAPPLPDSELCNQDKYIIEYVSPSPPPNHPSI